MEVEWMKQQGTSETKRRGFVGTDPNFFVPAEPAVSKAVLQEYFTITTKRVVILHHMEHMLPIAFAELHSNT